MQVMHAIPLPTALRQYPPFAGTRIQGIAHGARGRVHNPGFTLVEVLMVLAILGITTIVAMPSLVKSIRGNRLRVAARTVVMAGNYARTMAILKNQEMRLILDKTGNSVTVEPYRADTPAAPERGFEEPAPSPPPPAPSPSGESGSTEAGEAGPSAMPSTRISRQLDAVRIDSVTVEHKKMGTDEAAASVLYQTNGRCDPYEVRVVDEFGSAMVITVDAVASAKVRKEEE